MPGLPDPVRRRGRSLRIQLGRGARRLTADRRVLPDALLIGAQKSGTTSLSRYLLEHPDVRGADTGEVHFFDDRFGQGERAYRQHFPLEVEIEWAARSGPRPVVFEKSPKYLFHPRVPERVASM